MFTQDLPLSDRSHFDVPQPVSKLRRSWLFTASDVPPTEVTHGSPVGNSGCA